jgi:hypothetical protein
MFPKPKTPAHVVFWNQTRRNALASMSGASRSFFVSFRPGQRHEHSCFRAGCGGSLRGEIIHFHQSEAKPKQPWEVMRTRCVRAAGAGAARAPRLPRGADRGRWPRPRGRCCPQPLCVFLALPSGTARPPGFSWALRPLSHFPFLLPPHLSNSV